MIMKLWARRYGKGALLLVACGVALPFLVGLAQLASPIGIILDAPSLQSCTWDGKPCPGLVKFGLGTRRLELTYKDGRHISADVSVALWDLGDSPYLVVEDKGIRTDTGVKFSLRP